jgi:haloalkane dehalogenase
MASGHVPASIIAGRELVTVPRPAWVDDQLFPFESRFADIDGARVHYIDEGDGPVFLGLHGNPTWSFLYRHIVSGLRDRFRCVALDYPGFGLSSAPAGYGYTIAEHARVVERFVEQLGLREVTLMVQDWGGPIGMWVATHHPDWFRAFVIGNTWAWPVDGDRRIEWFSKLMGSARLGGLLVKRADIFVNVFMRAGISRRKLTPAERQMYKRAHPTPLSRVPVHVMPREILAAHELLSEVEQGLGRLVDKPALIVWGDQDQAFRQPQLRRWEQIFPNHRTNVLHGASHYIQEDAPDEIVAAINDWWPGRRPGE